MGLERKRGKSGSNHSFMSRKRAIRKMHLTANEFRRLCILKGIYPAEPKNNSWIKGKISQGKVYYKKDDIQFLSHEPIMWKFWEMKSFLKRIKRLKARKDIATYERMRESKPFYQLGHIVKERYPNFTDAIRDLDDCLSMLFMYARFAADPRMDHELVNCSRRLTVEFMHYVIDSRSLRKGFISVKGYYFQADIMGQTVTWIAPHEFVLPKLAEVDVSIMRSFTEFYVQLMGFVNYKLFTSNNMVYPARAIIRISDTAAAASAAGGDGMTDTAKMEMLEALNRPVLKRERIKDSDENQPDTFDEADMDGEKETVPAETVVDAGNGDDNAKAEKGTSGMTFAEANRLMHLFDGLKFFLNREVPREVMTFVCRSFGGDVSWHFTTAAGSTYGEQDACITHQIVDRNIPHDQKRLDRVYVQPQWLFDCVNARKLLPVQEYFPGCRLPPHLSPFIDESSVRPGTYVTPDAARLRGEEVLPISQDGVASATAPVSKRAKKRKAKSGNQEAAAGQQDDQTAVAPAVPDDRVKPGKQTKSHRKLRDEQLQAEEKKLAVMSIPKKKKQLYDKIMKLKKVKAKQADKLTAKRIAHENKVRANSGTQG